MCDRRVACRGAIPTNLTADRWRLAHLHLVLAAYAATDPAGRWPESWADAWSDHGPAHPLPPDHPLAAQRPEIDRTVLSNLLRLNHARSRGT